MGVRICTVGRCDEVVAHLSRDETRESVSVKQFGTVGELLMWLYSVRLRDEHTTFEGACVFVCYQARAEACGGRDKGSGLDSVDAAGLAVLLRDNLPCCNIVSVAAAEFIDYYENNISKEVYGETDRISNVYRWMYIDSDVLLGVPGCEAGASSSATACGAAAAAAGPPACSTNLYTMAAHLAYLNCDKRTLRGSSNLWEYLDVLDLIKSGLLHEDTYYWESLDSWNFCAHSLNCTELIWCSQLLLLKLAKDAELRHQPSANRLLLMLLNIEASYHQANKFHNFRHAVDVLQATYRLCQLLEIPKLESFLLCIAAIGHDVGHPGTNNMLFNKYHSPISQYYKQQSVLENFHADVYLDILSRYWPELSQEFVTIKDSIIATDMALHNLYVETINKETVPKLPGLTSLIIKAADISNVTRPLLISAKWAALISMEFNECALLEKSLCESKGCYCKNLQKCNESLEDVNVDIPSSIEEILIKYPNIPKGQLFFIDTFALSLFSGLS